VARHPSAKTSNLSDEIPQLAGLIGLLATLDSETIAQITDAPVPKPISVVLASPEIPEIPEPPPAIIPIVTVAVIPKFDEDRELNTYQALQQLLFGSELQELQQLDDSITLQISHLQQQLQDPDKLAKLLMPSIAEALQQRITHSESDIINVLAPIIEQIVSNRIQSDNQSDNQSMSETFASIVSPMLSKRIEQDSDDVASVISPVIGRALQKQVALESGPVIDALYPIIGGTISKYMAETVKQINTQIEDSFSVKGLTRKIRAKIQGVSEAELILKESRPFQVQALFLIHKTSGLVIAESQSDQQLEGDMMAGMLTAIRSFANDCMTQSNQLADLNILDYGASKVLLEVTGSSYLAVVMRGEIDPNFVRQMRQMMGDFVRHHNDSIEQFEGDPEAVPAAIPIGLETLRQLGSDDGEAKAASPVLMYLGLGLISAIVLPWGGWQYYQHQNHQAEAQAQAALLANPEVSVYNITVKAHWQQLNLTGRVPNSRLRQQAESLVKEKLPDRPINNQINAVQMPVATETTQAELTRLTQLLNQRPGSQIQTRFDRGHVQANGIVGNEQEARTVTETLAQIAGVDRLTSGVRIQQLYLETKIDFDIRSATLDDRQATSKLQTVLLFLQEHPDKYLNVIGHSKNIDNESEAAQLALDRANVVRHALIMKGASPDRLQIRASTHLPIGMKSDGNDALSRCVLFEVF
jgi:outer membrane protein OmpA-like peptidoglycan-associated protein